MARLRTFGSERQLMGFGVALLAGPLAFSCSPVVDSIGSISASTEAAGGATEGSGGRVIGTGGVGGNVGLGGSPEGTGGAQEQVCESGLPLRQRPEGGPFTLVDGVYIERSEANWSLVHNGEFITLQGQGYLAIRWNVTFDQNPGEITPPLFEVASGFFLRVGGGGDVYLGDPKPGTTGTYMGNVEEGLSYMAEGFDPPWKNEFYYIDGEVTIIQNETGGSYALTVYSQTYDDVVSSGDWGVYDPGVVCDPADP